MTSEYHMGLRPNKHQKEVWTVLVLDKENLIQYEESLVNTEDVQEVYEELVATLKQYLASTY